MNIRNLPSRIAVVGGGPVALTAAIGFAQALPDATVHWIPMPVAEAALADRWPLVLPSAQAMLARLDCPPDLLRRHGVATPRLATRFDDWSPDGAFWMVADEPAPASPGIALHQLWLRAGSKTGFHTLNPACVAADAGNVPPAMQPALHCSAPALTQGLASLARQSGVVTATAPLARVARGSIGVEALDLSDGRRIAVDLVIDATGPDRLVATGQGFEPWDAYLPFRHLRIVPDATPPSPIDRYRAVDGGWSARWPGARASASAKRDASGGAMTIEPGRLAAPLRDNVLALGDAAVQPGLLGLTGFTLALAGLALALELLPVGDDMALLAAEYNRRVNQRSDRMRDYLAAHQLCLKPNAEAMPPSLAATLAQFARRGTLPPVDEDSVERDAWIAVLIGQGLRPERADPIALGLSRDEARRALGNWAGQARAAAGKRTA
ncbi:tryptophan 7-halogenase [Sphingomonas sp. Leaf21]|uniref:tryptophan 7-halogenase n=1 Tax=Sphingomonas sp. Leaf21 TaxID=2876550 RepID=UPI001E648743|nr:tryptophan 7-halogenase [Sphingomonas sp. Leaf21]